MAVPASGQLCMQGLAKEKVYDNYSASPGFILAPISLYDLVQGGNTNGSGENYDETNTASPSYPPVVNTNMCFSAWYSYDHDYPIGPSWSTGGNMTTCRTWGSGTGASSNAGLMTQGACFDGPSGAQPSNWNNGTYEYNGSSWSTGGNHTIAGSNGSVTGTQNGALSANFNRCLFGNNVVETKSVYIYNGSSWSAKLLSDPDSVTCRCTGTTFPGVASTNAIIRFNGVGAGCNAYSIFNFGGVYTAESETNTPSSCRTYNAAGGSYGGDIVTTGGYGANGSLNMCSTEEYSGATWSSGGNLITGRKCLGGSNQGTVNSFCVWGGNICSSGYCAFSCTEVYNGSSWSTGPSMITAVRNSQNGGGTSSAFATGGVEGTVSSGYAILTTQELA